jgi:hypothetical protein
MSNFEAHLIPVKDNVQGDPIQIPSDGLVVGRDDECNHIIIGDGVSRFHATFYKKDNAFFVEDMDSTNGVSVNGRLVGKKAQIKPGDVIQICAFDFVIGGQATSEGAKPMVRVAALALILIAMLAAVVVAALKIKSKEDDNGGPRGQLTVLSSPTGAEVYDHGKKVGVTPMVFRNLAEGEYRLMLRMGGHLDKEVTLSVPQGGTKKIHTLEPILVGDGYLLIRTLPAGAKVFLDDKLVGTTVAGDEDEYISKPLKISNVNLDVEHRVYLTNKGNKSQTYWSKKWEPELDVILWAPDQMLVKKNGDSILGMLRSRDTDGSVELMISRMEMVRVRADEIAELRTVLAPIFKQNKGVERRKDADGILELIIDPFPDDEE